MWVLLFNLYSGCGFYCYMSVLYVGFIVICLYCMWILLFYLYSGYGFYCYMSVLYVGFTQKGKTAAQVTNYEMVRAILAGSEPHGAGRGGAGVGVGHVPRYARGTGM